MRKSTNRSLKAKAWKLFSEYIRRSYSDRHDNATCYTCGATGHWKSLQAGHAIPGRTNAVLLDEDVVRPQCVACNIYRRGNYPVFVNNLIKEHSTEWFDRKLADARRAVKYTKADWMRFIEIYKGKIQALEVL